MSDFLWIKCAAEDHWTGYVSQDGEPLNCEHVTSEPFIDAAYRGDVVKIRQMLVTATQCKDNADMMVRRLLETQDCDQRRATTIAAMNGYTELLKLLISDWGADSNYENRPSSGYTLLYWAVKRRNHDAARYLVSLTSGKNKVVRSVRLNPINAFDLYYTALYPLDIAIQNSDFEMVKILCEGSSVVKDRLWEIEQRKLHKCSVDLNWLIGYHANSPIQAAIFGTQDFRIHTQKNLASILKIVRYLVEEQGYPINAEDHVPEENMRYTVLNRLLSVMDVWVTRRNRFPRKAAMRILDLLLSLGADVSCRTKMMSREHMMYDRIVQHNQTIWNSISISMGTRNDSALDVATHVGDYYKKSCALRYWG